MNQPVLIQGVAGSGKSTIALHRISYLLYRYKDKGIKPENVLILAPNNMFLSYIQSVLPNLQIGQIQQETCFSLAKSMVPHLPSKIREPYETIAAIVDQEKDVTEEMAVESFKGSMRFMKMIDRYLASLEENVVNTIPVFEIHNRNNQKLFTFSVKEIEQCLNDFRHLPLEKRRTECFNRISAQKKEFFEQKRLELEEDWKDAQAKWVNAFEQGSQLRKQMYQLLEKAYHLKVAQLKIEVDQSWRKYQNNWQAYQAVNLYRKILTPELLSALEPDLDKELIEQIYKSTKQIGYADLAALLFIEFRLNGPSKIYDHIVIDEAQDLNPFLLYVLRSISKSNSMTILGDVTQSIFAHAGFSQWELVEKGVFGELKPKSISLHVSYRSTFEIVQLANKVLENGNLPYQPSIPIQRHGDPVKITRIYSGQELLEKIVDSIEEFYQKGYGKIAIIHKDREASKKLYKLLVEKGVKSIQLVLEPKETIREKIILIPSYIAKGLEFDAVIIPNASERRYQVDKLDAKLLYVSVTRPHHGLHIYYHDQLTPLLKGCVEEDDSVRDEFGIL